MNPDLALVDDVVTILAGWTTRRGKGRAGAAAVYDAVHGRMRRTGTTGVYEEFADSPSALAPRRHLAEVLERLFREDPGFEQTVADLVASVRPVRERAGAPWRVIALSGAAVVAAAAVVVYLSMDEAAPLDGDIACRDFWSLAEPDQRDLLARLYRERLQPRRAEDPTLVAATLYACGQGPARTINQVIDGT